MLKLFNSLSQKIEDFKPQKKQKVSMYVCGITPYDTTHLGHAFTYLSFDVLHRYLNMMGKPVTYTQNVTDIDDDILKKAKEVGKDWKELGEFWTQKFLNDLKALNVMMPTHFVKATESIPTVLEIIEDLVKKEYAYEKDGNVYFRVKKFTDYGKLSHYDQNTMIKLSKERGADPDDPRKKEPLDFIMWQKSLAGEPSWESPYEAGRPGWHIECSAMIYKYLDVTIDIHGGGSDLLYPHHESEIAQSEAFIGKKPFVGYWMHTGAVGYQGEKMSKSLGNLVMISDLLKKYSPNTIRYLLLSHHYREPWEFDERELKKAEKESQILWDKIKKSTTKNTDTALTDEFLAYIADDLNTPKALQLLVDQANKPTNGGLTEMSMLLGFYFSE